ncbi:MAG: hypothetical protein ACI4SS_05555, partial [Clostridia bacterium]
MKKCGKRSIAAIMAGLLAIGSFQSFAAEREPQIKIVDMTTEYQTNPLGIDTDCVRFGWKMESDKIGSRQTAYEIRV